MLEMDRIRYLPYTELLLDDTHLAMPGILIVDDLRVARTAIRALLDSYSMPVSGEVGNGKEAIEKVKELRPGLILSTSTCPRWTESSPLTRYAEFLQQQRLCS